MSEVAAPAETSARPGWWVQVRGHAYGPYTLEQMTHFVEEGRVRPATRISDQPSKGWIEARRVDALMSPLRGAAGQEESPAAEGANIFVHAEIVTGAWGAFMAALESMGPICELAPGLWLVRTRLSAGVVRNTLSQTLEKGDRFVVIDATRDRLAWFSLGPGVDVAIGQVWNAPLKPERK
ncbi:MAG TPA: GYF domain-containing protein [Caulobacterales bacterium]|nr:GYF domain-containing protein [Caulobacterales bacterium]